eukprot:CAMPEP_0180483380 /NCGR_PEP_ID=MMETSP1036_2-20121128/35393_1 /TAXON_ID=632150 /ORGANISM="Azadinium spinosum, Strain 3D9" /LENGTH=62 /DNA_ID=CAMNT_0022491187 /DNA_START=44 /DNA_END=232 /DNA_ORIENTATION=+
MILQSSTTGSSSLPSTISISWKRRMLYGTLSISSSTMEGSPLVPTMVPLTRSTVYLLGGTSP